MIYLDSSALVKLVVAETHSEAVRQIVAAEEVVSCELALAEVQRAVWSVRIGRRGREQLALRARTEDVLGALAYVPVDRGLLLAAAHLPPVRLRTLDAVHVAAALTIADDLSAFVTYDERQREAAEGAELPVLQPRD